MLWLDGSVPPPGPDQIVIPRWMFQGLVSALVTLTPAFLGVVRSWFKLRASKGEALIAQETRQKDTLDALHKRIDEYGQVIKENQNRIHQLEKQMVVLIERDRWGKSQPIDLPELPQVDRTRRFRRPKPSDE